MTVNGYTRTCGLIGNPVEHTMSPAIHHFLAEHTGQNLTYVPFHVENGRLEAAVQGGFALNILGMNVTVPYKRDVLPYLCDVDELAEKIGAVNTLVRTDEGYKGYNTDMPGLYRAMQTDDVHVVDENVLVLGAGGVARAVVLMLATKGAKKIIILNRTAGKAEEIAKEVNTMFGKDLVHAMALSDYEKLSEGQKYLAVQATNVGMFPNTEEAVIEDPEFYRHVHTGYDLIFNPAKTRFMKLVENAGGRAFNGLKMLVFQGIIAYEYWTGQMISDELAEECCKHVNGLIRQN